MRKKLIILLRKYGILTPKQSNHIDYTLLFLIIFLIVFGLLMIYSASSYKLQMGNHSPSQLMDKQMKIAIASFMIMLMVSYIDYHFILKCSYGFYYIVFAVLVFVTTLGRVSNGSRRWLRIAGNSLQPSEFGKLAVILIMSLILANLGKKRGTKEAWYWIGIFVFPMVILIAFYNLSAGLIVLGIAFIMSFVNTNKAEGYYILGFLGIVFYMIAEPLVAFIIKLPFLRDYQANRFLVWIDPEKYQDIGGGQVLESLYAIGSGGLFGRGLGESIQKRKALAEASNDMIFSIICEELGVMGAALVIFVFIIFLYRLQRIAQNAPDKYGALIVTGVMAHIGVQVILNIAVATNAIPNTGITLPFISHGGTALLSIMIEMGLVFAVSRQIK